MKKAGRIPGPRPRGSRSGMWWIPVVALLAAAVYLSLATDRFATERNLTNLVAQAGPLLLVSLGQMLVVVIRGLDLSVGAVISLTTAIVALELPAPVSLPLALLAGACVGLVNGTLTVRFRVHPIIATLAMAGILQGVTQLLRPVAGGRVPEVLGAVVNGSVGPVSTPILLALVAIGGMTLLLHRSRLGLHLFAVGGGETAGSFGVAEGRTRITAYVLCSVLATLTGLFIAGRIGSGDPNIGGPFSVDSITAVALGGTQLAGGIGSVGGTVAGAAFLALLSNGMNLLNVSAFVQTILKGTILLVVVLLQPRKNIGL